MSKLNRLCPVVVALCVGLYQISRIIQEDCVVQLTHFWLSLVSRYDVEWPASGFFDTRSSTFDVTPGSKLSDDVTDEASLGSLLVIASREAHVPGLGWGSTDTYSSVHVWTRCVIPVSSTCSNITDMGAVFIPAMVVRLTLRKVQEGAAFFLSFTNSFSLFIHVTASNPQPGEACSLCHACKELVLLQWMGSRHLASHVTASPLLGVPGGILGR